MESARVPAATYRLQFNRGFRFDDARALLPYLEALGVTDLYASPLLQARRGSSHGYDVTDPTRLNPELGTEGEFEALVQALKERGMGLLLDIVPNHMAASGENRWWMDVLANGPASRFAVFFDIDWHAPKKALERKVLLPILGSPYGRVLENRELLLHLDKAGFAVRYHRTKLPLSVASYARILGHRLELLEETHGPDHPSLRELLETIAAIEHAPDPAAVDPETAESRRREEENIRRKLWDLYVRRAEIRAHIDENIRIVNGRRGDAESFALLDRLLSEQWYRLSFWRLANEEINYRRFFALNDLVGIRVELPAVFEASHALILKFVREGKVTGLRADHIDGLCDPQEYLSRLAGRLPSRDQEQGDAAGCYVVVEKILGEGETLPADWPVRGTTGYDFLNTANGIFVSARGARELDGVYTRFLGAKAELRDVVYEKKKLVMETLFAGEMHALGQHLGRLAEQDRYARDLPRKELRQALVEVTACFPVYRTYIRGPDPSIRDRLHIGRALKEAIRRGADDSAPVFDFLRRVLMLETPAFAPAEQKDDWLRFVMRWQQFTGPITAKGYEDTALYVYNRLISMNEVGGDAAGTGVPAKTFHARAAAALSRWPGTMNATTTHDTKRSEDVRTRINVLSELPGEWEKRLLQWSGWNEGRKRILGGRPVPDRNEEIFLYQTLLGAWPLDANEMPDFARRLKEYMVKALREAKVHSRWIRTEPGHESAVAEFVEAILTGPDGNPFLEDFLPFQRKVAHYGMLNSLGQVLLKIASPGVPDFYQGTELWDFRLVDPDNRGPVDFTKRARMLSELSIRGPHELLPLAQELVSRWEDGRIKLFLTSRALAFRRSERDLFLSGSYLPLEISGGKKEHALACARSKGGSFAVAAVPRLLTRLVAPGEFPLGQKVWGGRGGLVLPEGSPSRFRNVLTGEFLRVSTENGRALLPLHGVFSRFPVALLSGDSA